MPAGSLVFLRDPAVKRYARAEEPGTTVLAVGGKPGAARGLGLGALLRRRTPSLDDDPERAIAEIEAGLARAARITPALLRTTARASSAAPAGSTRHARRSTAALELDPDLQQWADEDEDLAPLRASG